MRWTVMNMTSWTVMNIPTSTSPSTDCSCEMGHLMATKCRSQDGSRCWLLCDHRRFVDSPLLLELLFIRDFFPEYFPSLNPAHGNAVIALCLFIPYRFHNCPWMVRCRYISL